MPANRTPDRPRVTLEQLLALKRSERPDPSFWEGFDRELHRRQLASVVVRPTWYARATRVFMVGLRRAAPVAMAGAAAVVGFIALQPSDDPGAVSPEAATAANVSTAPAPTEAEADALVAAIPVVVADEPAAPVFERPETSETRFVVHEFVANTAPARTFISVNSPNTFSSPAYDASLEMVNTLTSGVRGRGGLSPEAGSF